VDWRGWIGNAVTEMGEWCRGRSWVLRIPLWLFMLWTLLSQFFDPMSWNPLDALNLPIHEGGHLLFRGGGEWLCAAGGTILEFLAPIGAGIMFYRQPDYFGVAVTMTWLGTAMNNSGIYMADAMRLELPLVTVGDPQGPIGHDWQYLFGTMGLLQQCELIGALMRGASYLLMLAALVYGGWLMVQMYRQPEVRRRQTI